MDNAFLVRLNMSLYTARKMDKAATKAAKERAGASDKAGVKVYKSTLAADTLDAIHQIANAARIEHRKRTVPWTYEGAGAITVEGYPAYKAAMAEYEKQFNAAKAAFYAAYADEREAARVFLGNMFNETDYPTTGELDKKFSFAMRAEPMPRAEHFAPAGLPPQEAAIIRQDIVNQNHDALANANNEGWRRVIESVELLQQRLREYSAGDVTRFYESWLDNVKELAGLIPSINIANDPDLTRMARRLIALTAYKNDDLKASADLRAEVIKQAGAILAGIGEAHRKAA